MAHEPQTSIREVVLLLRACWGLMIHTGAFPALPHNGLRSAQLHIWGTAPEAAALGLGDRDSLPGEKGKHLKGNYSPGSK